jgi:curved DNA-binding protein CbpA
MPISDEASRAAIRAWIDQQHQQLQHGSYYTILGVERTANASAIRTAYYQMVARFHPDLYGADSLDETTRAKLVSLYSRLVEAYRVLADGQRRALYDKNVSAGKLRLTQEEERLPQKRDPEAELSNPNAKRFYKMARTALLAGDAKNAIMNLRFALSAEPNSEALKAELASALALAAGKK